MHLGQPTRLAFPHSGLDHPPAQSFFPYPDLIALGQLFGGEGRTKIRSLTPIR
jgi:hypothetical protein